MITGFNTDVPHNGKAYHVQTEDRGLRNPIVESLVYAGGEIITSRKTPYQDLLDSGEYSESVLLKRMEIQHKELMHEIRGGGFDSEQVLPYGHTIVTNRSLDEIVRLFIDEHVELDQISIDLAEMAELQEGHSQLLRLKVVEGEPERPVSGANVVVKLLVTGDSPRELFAAPTDEDGNVEAALEIPVTDGANAAIVCEAFESGRSAELTRLVRKQPKASVDPS